jgi:hypothetical protein
VRIGLVLDNYSPHLSTRVDQNVGEWAKANNVELAYVPTDASWLNRIECHFAALRYFALDGTDHRDHIEQNDMIRRYISIGRAFDDDAQSAQWLSRVFGPSADAPGQALGRGTEFRLRNIGRIVEKADQKLGDRADGPGSVPLRVIGTILDEGSYCDDELIVEYLVS